MQAFTVEKDFRAGLVFYLFLLVAPRVLSSTIRVKAVGGHQLGISVFSELHCELNCRCCPQQESSYQIVENKQ